MRNRKLFYEKSHLDNHLIFKQRIEKILTNEIFSSFPNFRGFFEIFYVLNEFSSTQITKMFFIFVFEYFS